MYYDLNNVIPDIDIASLNDYDWEVKVVDKTNNGKPLSIIEVKFVDDTTGGEYDLLDGKTYTINGSSKVFSTSNVTFPFSADVKVSPSSIHTLEEVRITALTKGGKAPFKYQFELEKDGNKTMLEPFCNNFECYKRLNAAGDCTIVLPLRIQTATQPLPASP